MTLSTVISYSVSVVLEATILFRCVQTRIFREYPFFWAYLCCVFLGDVVMLPASKLLTTEAFRSAYWTREFVCVLAGYAVLMEIVEKAFAYFDGPKKLGRNAAMLTLAAVVGVTSFEAMAEHVFYTVRTTIQVEANLRGAELILLSIVIAVTSYYSIPVGRNLKGIIVGYGICTVAVALNEAFRSFAGPSFQATFAAIWSYSYVVSLVIWGVMLWTYEANPEPVGWSQMAGDYEALAIRTKTTLAGMRGYFRKAARP